jgi:Family of unknown function (DUF5996)
VNRRQRDKHRHLPHNFEMADAHEMWPELPLEEWKDTYDTLHMWAQIVGKIRLRLAPRQNHWWNCALYVSTRGLTTSPIPYQGSAFEIQFNFVDHRLELQTSNGVQRATSLSPKSVAAFYRELFSMLQQAGIDV